jgi:hypothetical protein
MQANWKGLLNLLTSAAIWGITAFIGTITLAPGIPTKASLSLAGLAALVSVVQHLRAEPQLWKSLMLVPVALAMAGCLSTNMTEYAKAIGQDTANICIAVSTPYGGGVLGRVNTPGATMNMSGGQCKIDTAPPK